MDEYIKREEAIEWFMPYAHAGESIDADVVISDIKGMKAADVAPVRHGRWKAIKSNGIGGTGRCSCCEKAIYGYRAYNYCPNCGAKMDGGFDNG